MTGGGFFERVQVFANERSKRNDAAACARRRTASVLPRDSIAAITRATNQRLTHLEPIAVRPCGVIAFVGTVAEPALRQGEREREGRGGGVGEGGVEVSRNGARHPGPQYLRNISTSPFIATHRVGLADKEVSGAHRSKSRKQCSSSGGHVLCGGVLRGGRGGRHGGAG